MYVRIALLVAALIVLGPLRRRLVASLFGKSIGQAALAKQPDSIRLQRCEPSSLKHADKVDALAREYRDQRFEDVGAYSVPELKGMQLRLLANPHESMYGAIYDHPNAGVWCDVVNRYADGSAWTFTTAKPTGITPLSNVRMVNAPGSTPSQLIEQARSTRPGLGLRSATTASAVADFERAYGEYIAALKQRGLSTGEVVKVAGQKAA